MLVNPDNKFDLNARVKVACARAELSWCLGFLEALEQEHKARFEDSYKHEPNLILERIKKAIDLLELEKEEVKTSVEIKVGDLNVPSFLQKKPKKQKPLKMKIVDKKPVYPKIFICDESGKTFILQHDDKVEAIIRTENVIEDVFCVIWSIAEKQYYLNRKDGSHLYKLHHLNYYPDMRIKKINEKEV